MTQGKGIGECPAGTGWVSQGAIGDFQQDWESEWHWADGHFQHPHVLAGLYSLLPLLSTTLTPAQTAERRFPNLFNLVMDILSTQASSVPCQCLFSSGKETYTAHRNRIQPKLMEALQALKFSSHSNSLSGPLCHLVCSLQTEHYSAEDTLYQNLTPWWKQYPSTRAYTRTGL